MTKAQSDSFDDIEDEFMTSDLEHVVGGRAPIGQIPVSEEALLHGGIDTHTSAHSNAPHHSGAPPHTQAHHVDLHGWLGIAGHSIDHATAQLDNAFAELTNDQHSRDVDSHILLGRAISSDIANGNHPYTFQWSQGASLADLPHGQGPAFQHSHLPDHRGGPGGAANSSSTSNTTSRSNPGKQS